MLMILPRQLDPTQMFLSYRSCTPGSQDPSQSSQKSCVGTSNRNDNKEHRA